MLLAAGASLDTKDSLGNGPADLAETAGDHDLAEYLRSECQILSFGIKLSARKWNNHGAAGDVRRHKNLWYRTVSF